MNLSDDALLDAAVDLANQHASGITVPASVESLLRAAALTRQEARRHALERQAAARLEQAGQTALVYLRVLLALA